jgi:hypothetical protein
MKRKAVINDLDSHIVKGIVIGSEDNPYRMGYGIPVWA